jgi:uncharacterized protein YndB with AHSA1/START domain
MVLRDKVEIKSSPERVWSYISDPGQARKWNGGIRAIVPISAGEWTAGSRWRVRFEFHGRESNYLAEALEFEKPLRLVVHLTGGDMPVNGYLQEIYDLSPSEKGTMLRYAIAFSGSGLNLLSAWAKFLSHHLFRPRSKRYLLKLKKLAEDNGWH